ncbi:hypothetical protein GCM10025771_36530 [Niveibacterium umoris]|uniref:Flagellar FliJ protein n=1 Tax=Niveibacterium umoris TaxID=1193620 RepID=A0A840BHR5_9RHOO|nr:flagellar export protein FliJ [Niveibacterium umoris]MBB4011149.1 flagellar FliJ protein [Niveibacterium umoris]
MANALQTLLELAQNRMDDAAKRLGELLASGQAHEQKLEILVQYRAEYHERFKSAAQTGISPDAWRNYSTFLAKLDEAVFEQEQVVARARDQVVAGKQAWVDERNRKKAFDTLASRQQAHALRKEHRAEQRITDEHSAKLYRGKSQDADDESEAGE